MELIQAIEDLLWWVQDGLDNADLTNRQYSRTVKCKETVLKHLAELKNNNPVEDDRATSTVCGRCCYPMDTHPRTTCWGEEPPGSSL